jgi:hypothetical protein
MFWHRKVQTIQTDRDAADALYADIMTFGKRNGHALAATPEPQPVALALAAQPDGSFTTVLQIARDDREQRRITFDDLQRAVRQARILHSCGYEVLIHHRTTSGSLSTV